MTETTKPLYRIKVWDRNVRAFHWINVICVIGLIFLGTALLNNKALGVSSDGKILLKTVHAYFGYVFVLNLAWRLVWGFIGNRYARWKHILPFEKGFMQAKSEYMEGMRSGNPPAYAGHNPMARLMVTFLFILMITQATTGLVLAGTDLYLPPFGHEIAEWVTASGEDHSKLEGLKAGSKSATDEAAYKEMRAFRKPYITVHYYIFYLICAAALLHILAVIITEIKERNGLVSAMITGEKVFDKTPVDLDADS